MELTTSGNRITEVTAHHFCDISVRSKLEVTPTLQRKASHKSINTMRQGSLGPSASPLSLGSCLPWPIFDDYIQKLFPKFYSVFRVFLGDLFDLIQATLSVLQGEKQYTCPFFVGKYT